MRTREEEDGTPPGWGHIYVVGFGKTPDTVVRIKVGMSTVPEKRVYAINRQSQTGLPPVVTWISPAHMEYRDNEFQLLSWCIDQYDDDFTEWPTCGSEWFDGLDPQAVIDAGMELLEHSTLTVPPRAPYIGLSPQSAARRRRTA